MNFKILARLLILCIVQISPFSAKAADADEFGKFCELVAAGLLDIQNTGTQESSPEAVEDDDNISETPQIMMALEQNITEETPNRPENEEPNPQNTNDDLHSKINEALRNYFRALYGDSSVWIVFNRPRGNFRRAMKPAANLTADDSFISMPSVVATGVQANSQDRSNQATELKELIAELKAQHGEQILPEYYHIILSVLGEVQTKMEEGAVADILAPLKNLVIDDAQKLLDVITYVTQMEMSRAQFFQFAVRSIRTQSLSVSARSSLSDDDESPDARIWRALHEINVAFFSEYTQSFSQQTLETLEHLRSGEIGSLSNSEKLELQELLSLHKANATRLTQARKNYSQTRNAAKLAYGLLELLATPDGRNALELGSILTGPIRVNFDSRHAIAKSIVTKVLEEQLAIVDDESSEGSIQIKIPELGNFPVRISQAQLNALGGMDHATIDRLLAAQLMNDSVVEDVVKHGAVEALEREVEYLKEVLEEGQSEEMAEASWKILNKLKGYFFASTGLDAIPGEVKDSVRDTLGKIFRNQAETESSNSPASAPQVITQIEPGLGESLNLELIPVPWLLRDAIRNEEGALNRLRASLTDEQRRELNEDEQVLLEVVENLQKRLKTGSASKSGIILEHFLHLLNARALQVYNLDIQTQMFAYNTLNVIPNQDLRNIERHKNQLLDVMLKVQGALKKHFLALGHSELDAIETLAWYLSNSHQSLVRLILNHPGHSELMSLRTRLMIRTIIGGQQTYDDQLATRGQLENGQSVAQRQRNTRRNYWITGLSSAAIAFIIAYATIPSLQNEVDERADDLNGIVAPTEQVVPNEEASNEDENPPERSTSAAPSNSSSMSGANTEAELDIRPAIVVE